MSPTIGATVRGTQFVAGLVVIVYTLLLLLDTGADAAEAWVPRYFDVGDGRCTLDKRLCFEPTRLIIACRIAKETTNWVSPWIETNLTPKKYSTNAQFFESAIERLLQHAGGAKCSHITRPIT